MCTQIQLMGWHFGLPPDLALAQPCEDQGRNNQDMERRADHYAENRRCQRFHDLRAGAGRPHQRQQSGYDGCDGQDFRSQSQQCAFDYSLMQSVERECPLRSFNRNGFFQVNHHDYPSLNRRSEKCDESDPYRNGEVVTQPFEKRQTPGQGKRNGVR
jgi:hypothetical protein